MTYLTDYLTKVGSWQIYRMQFGVVIHAFYARFAVPPV